MTEEVRSEPCQACPYRVDVPSGLWERHEYEKLLAYDRTTDQQPLARFACHATPDSDCAGWFNAAQEQTDNRASLALRWRQWTGRKIDPHTPMFPTHTEAAEHGLRDVDDPSPEAVEAMARLLGKHPRLQSRDD